MRVSRVLLNVGFPHKLTETNMDHAIAGAASGFFTRFICQPLDVIKIRFQASYRAIKYTCISMALLSFLL